MGDIVSNPKARRDFHILEVVEAGIALRGTEVKSLRAGRGQIQDAFARVDNGEVFLYNARIDEYSHGNRNNHQPSAVRKLLLHKNEIRKLEALSAVKGNVLVPLGLYWKKRHVKVALAAGKSKVEHDHRDDMKEREADRELKRAMMHRLKGR